MRQEDKKLKDAIEKHYFKLITMERNFKYESFKFSSCMTDVMTALGFQKSKNNEDELSKESKSAIDEES